MGFVNNTNQMANSLTSSYVREAAQGPKRWTVEVFTAQDVTLWVRIAKGKRWTQAPILSTRPPRWGQFEPFDPPGKWRNWDAEIRGAIRKAMR